MRLIHNALKILTTGVTALLISACGGGGSSSAPTAATTATTTAVTTAEENADQKGVIKLAVVSVDAVSALDTLLNLVGVENVVGSATKTLVACPGGGTVEGSKANNQIVVRANKCIPYAGEILQHDGTWNLNRALGEKKFNADGSCTGSCQLQLLTYSGSFGALGNGKSSDPLFDMIVTVTAQGAERTVESYIPIGHLFQVEGEDFRINGNLIRKTNSTQASTVIMTIWSVKQNAKIFEVKGGLDRSPLTLSHPYPAAISFTKTGVTANVDENKDGTKELLLDIKWADFQ